MENIDVKRMRMVAGKKMTRKTECLRLIVLNDLFERSIDGYVSYQRASQRSNRPTTLREMDFLPISD